jgi:hypothetical protein
MTTSYNHVMFKPLYSEKKIAKTAMCAGGYARFSIFERRARFESR